MLKCSYDQIRDVHVCTFLYTVANISFLDILPNFNPLHLLKNTSRFEIIIIN